MSQTHDFNRFKVAVAAQFERMQRGTGQLFRVNIPPDDLWAAYLGGFPPGTNPIYRERSEHDCSCCRQFVRSIGDVVGIVDGTLVSIWSVTVPGEPAYQTVADALAAKVLAAEIAEPFLHYEAAVGTDKSFEELAGVSPEGVKCEGAKAWTHFRVNLDKRFVRPKAEIPTLLGERRATHDVFLRSLTEISADAIETVLDLIAQGSLYRGEEHRATVTAFRAAQEKFAALPDDDGGRARDLFAWTADASGAVRRIRNTVIGTLLVDLSEGLDLEASVRAFEAKVAPTNYKRPSALVTPGMIKLAKAKIEELGLTSALERRYARLADIKIGDLLFADRSTRKAISGDVFDELIETAPAAGKKGAAAKNLDKIEEVPISRFIAEIVPRVDSMEIMVENRFAGNFLSLIAPADPTARQLLKWRNGFSWSYAGEVADAIKERVKLAGGNVTGDLCCRLAWSNRDDLDFHMIEPGGYEIYFGNRSTTSPSGGRLDVDMNVHGETREPVENIFYSSRAKMRDGVYSLIVNQFNARETVDVGFEVQIDYRGTVYRFSYAKPVRGGESIVVAKFKYHLSDGLEIIESESLPMSEAARTIWSVPTQTFRRVSALMLSPNHWEGEGPGGNGVGNRHYIFALDGCANPDGARGFYNEFLAESLTPHRKVFEIVGARMKPADSAEQVSGLGFSSTARNTAVVRVKGSFSRVVRVVF